MPSYKEQIDTNRIPNHIAIIMDGNGRWAKQQGKERNYGHQAGVASVHAIAEEASKTGVRFLTLYTFSTENWNRPLQEVGALMDLLVKSMEEEIFMKNNICFRTIGDINKMPVDVQKCFSHCIEKTSHNTGMIFVLALSYSSRWEITETVRQIARQVQCSKLSPEDITENLISSYLNTNFMPDPDLLIRTGGDIRLSNYLLWQSAYTELYFCDTFWPDFREEDLLKAIYNYQQRERRFGKTGEQIQ
ncbi:Isoprenyl transferase [termite gut metagenome]|uniref:Isoprenyl transferase n=1 Tax=termite gut metagenome TaxID=433724 RepID=A0A5J4SW30_9ZZZZ